MSESNSIGLHVRKSNYNISLGKDYYNNAIKTITEKINNYLIFCFSDDIEWCKKEFNNLNNIYFIEGNLELEDFWLMQQCKHFIISNSTFSWWASWLGKKNLSIIISPSKEHWPNSKTINKYHLVL